MSDPGMIHVVGARQHNLKNIEVRIPRGKVTVITGLSGSGKSSLAFDTIHAEGRRRYVESLSVLARQFLEQMPPPDVDRIEGLSPTIAIEQRVTSTGPRSTVAIATEVYDYLRVLFARLAQAHCWICDRPIVRQSISEIVDAVQAGTMGSRMMILAPLATTQTGSLAERLEQVRKEGFLRARIDGQVVQLEEWKAPPSDRHPSVEIVVDRLVLKPDAATRLADSIEAAARLGDGRVTVTTETGADVWTDNLFSTVLACPAHPEVRIDSPGPQLFSFNSVHGACPECHGLGIRMDFDPELIVPDRSRSLRDGAIVAWRHAGRREAERFSQRLAEFCQRFGVDESIPFRELTEESVHALFHGPTPDNPQHADVRFDGLLAMLQQRWAAAGSEGAKQRLYAFLAESPCDRCAGTRLRREALAFRWAGRTIAELTALTIDDANRLFADLTFNAESGPIAAPLVLGIRQRLQFLVECGVAYLTLNRGTTTLSGGEWQRIRLATQIGGGLSGVCYVLDEPTIGLHPADSHRLSQILRRLSSMANTVIVVEHDAQIIRGADHLIEIGPGAGAHGGYVTAAGPLSEVLSSNDSVTAQYLSGTRSVPIPRQRRPFDPNRCIKLHGINANNLKDVNVGIPLGLLVCITGVSGSGKSTLVHDVLLRAVRRHLDRGGLKPLGLSNIIGADSVTEVIEVDQSPIGRTPRSNPASYVGVLSLIRELFAVTREAKIRGYGPQRFSFNVRGGRCEHCEGQGTRRISLHFLPDVHVPCAHCDGRRYNRETLEIRYRGKSIADVLDMRVEEAVAFFENIPRIKQRVDCLNDVGLGYVTLGQAANTLSGGEAQRVKLAARLHRAGIGHTLYLLDEPTSGLHFVDVTNLLKVLQQIVDRGHTLVVIEHNLDVIKSADWVIDLGPGAGAAGGRIIAEGSPEMIAASTDSHTGRFLQDLLVRT